LERPGHPELGADSGRLAGAAENGVPLSQVWSEPPQVVIDFSLPEGAESILRTCLEQKVPLVMATTGLSPQQQAAVQRAAEQLPMVVAPNMSLAVNLGMKLAEQAGAALRGHDADVEITERHHRFKEDAPSGTALKFGEILAQAMGLDKHQHGRQGVTGQRPRGEIGYHAIRAGDNPGEHTIVFGLLGETLEITVRATSRDAYALGALAAAKFVVHAPPGVHSMFDVLGL
jgi:4-hydroxy-tetrahydrodipicolinate reductase